MSASAHKQGPHTSNAWLLIAYIALLYFGLGAGLLQSFLNDTLLVFALALRVPVTLALLWRRPHLFPQSALWVALLGQLIGWTSSSSIPIPVALPFVCEAVAELWILRRVVDELAVASAPTVE